MMEACLHFPEIEVWNVHRVLPEIREMLPKNTAWVIFRNPLKSVVFDEVINVSLPYGLESYGTMPSGVELIAVVDLEKDDEI